MCRNIATTGLLQKAKLLRKLLIDKIDSISIIGNRTNCFLLVQFLADGNKLNNVKIVSDLQLINLGILVSDRGSNMEAILQKIRDGVIKNVKPCVVISNKPNARALEIARQHDVNAVFIDDEGKKGANWEYDEKIVECLQENKVMSDNGLVCLAGFMRIISKEFVQRYRWRIMNIHPALLPSFLGLNAQKQALEYGVKITGCTVHFVDEVVDTGPIIIQASVEVKDNDTVDTLAARILEQEHRVYPEAVRLFAEGKLAIEGRKVKIR